MDEQQFLKPSVSVAQPIEFLSRLDLGFPAKADYRFRLKPMGKAYTVTGSGVRMLKLLSRLQKLARANPDVAWAIPGRDLIREIVRLEHTPLLSLVIERAQDDDLRRTAVWLRGKCAGTIGTSILIPLLTHSDLKLRKEVARTLGRLKAWHLIRRMLAVETEPRIRMLLNPPAKRYVKRLRRFTQGLKSGGSELSTGWFYLDPRVELDRIHAPKPVELIRVILQRISKLLRNRV